MVYEWLWHRLHRLSSSSSLSQRSFTDPSVIMDVMNVEQAKIAEEAGAVAVMALERIPANIRRDGGVARMVSPLQCGIIWFGSV